MSEVNFTEASGSPAETSAAAAESAKIEAARAELYDEAAGSEQGGDGLILGKYQSTEDLAQAYQNLQREFSRLKNGQPPSDPAPEQQAPVGYDDTEQDEAAGDSGRIDPATATAIHNAVLEQAGGEAEYQRLANWALNNLPADRTEAYNAALAAGDQASIMNSLKGLQYDFMMQNGYEPRLTGGRAPSNEVRGFASRYQVTEAMSDPRYEKDAGYRQEVERRIAASADSIFGYQG
jgi:hypothetical protein